MGSQKPGDARRSRMAVILCSYGKMWEGGGEARRVPVLWMLVVTATLVSTAVSDDDDKTLSQTRLKAGTEN